MFIRLVYIVSDIYYYIYYYNNNNTEAPQIVQLPLSVMTILLAAFKHTVFTTVMPADIDIGKMYHV